MATLKELRDERLRKLEELKSKGINPYPSHVEITHALDQIVSNFQELENQKVTVVGRVVGIRKLGKIAFIVIRNPDAKLQLFLKSEDLVSADTTNSEINFSELNLLDSGDFVQAEGTVIKTQTGEISVALSKLRIIVKSLRPMPTDRDGFTNKEERLRRRYIDLNLNPDVYQRFIRRSHFWQTTRDFLINEDFIEINIPVLENTPGGADAKPFVTHMDALGQDFYLRISHELPLKRLLGGGYEKVFDIGPRFRNENYSDEHLPEHVAMEWYWAYADWEKGMKLTQRLIREVADKTWNKRKFKLRNEHEIDLGTDDQDWPKISFVEVIKEKYSLDVFSSSLEECKAKLVENHLEVAKEDNRARIIDKLWKKIRVDIPGPSFLVDIPVFLQPLAKAQSADNRLCEQFNLILGGSEVCKAYSELNDPQDQLARFLQQQSMRESGDEEAQMLDIDFVEMLEYGMPPACGFGYSERLFWTLEGVTAREGVPFPQLRQEIDPVTKSTYPEVYKSKKRDSHE